MKDDADFRRRTDDALRTLLRMLAAVAEDFGFRTSLAEGALKIEFDRSPAPILVSPNQAAHQVWVTNGAKTRKLGWDIVENAFVLEATGQDLQQVVEEAVSQRVGEDITL
jgi:frataxin-like iron-binding protein CyaY